MEGNVNSQHCQGCQAVASSTGALARQDEESPALTRWHCEVCTHKIRVGKVLRKAEELLII